jgi:outer membrane receptor protein involved in Fe transport
VVKNKMVEDKTNPPHVEYQQMYGTYVNFHPKYLTLEGSYYRQSGQVLVADMHTSTIKAWMASGKATVKPTDRYGFELGYDYLSGDDFVPVTYGGTMGLPLHSVEGGFTPLYGSRTKFYGIMDYFYESAYIHGFTPGLQNAFVGASGKPIPKMSCSATYHYLAVATNLTNLDRTLGHSVELEASYRFSEVLNLTVGYTWMYGTETMDRLKESNGSKSAQWGCFSLVLSPKLFTTKF